MKFSLSTVHVGCIVVPLQLFLFLFCLQYFFAKCQLSNQLFKNKLTPGGFKSGPIRWKPSAKTILPQAWQMLFNCAKHHQNKTPLLAKNGNLILFQHWYTMPCVLMDCTYYFSQVFYPRISCCDVHSLDPICLWCLQSPSETADLGMAYLVDYHYLQVWCYKINAFLIRSRYYGKGVSLYTKLRLLLSSRPAFEYVRMTYSQSKTQELMIYKSSLDIMLTLFTTFSLPHYNMYSKKEVRKVYTQGIFISKSSLNQGYRMVLIRFMGLSKFQTSLEILASQTRVSDF